MVDCAGAPHRCVDRPVHVNELRASINERRDDNEIPRSTSNCIMAIWCSSSRARRTCSSAFAMEERPSGPPAVAATSTAITSSFSVGASSCAGSSSSELNSGELGGSPTTHRGSGVGRPPHGQPPRFQCDSPASTACTHITLVCTLATTDGR